MQTGSQVHRRARLATRHHLAPTARNDDVAALAGDLLGLHATDPASVYLAAMARMATPDVSAIDEALYTRRSVIRMLGMRRTMFVVPVELAAIVRAACTRDVAARERRRTIKMLADAQVAPDPDRWFRDVERATLAALRVRGGALSRDLHDDVPELARSFVVGAHTRWPARLTVASRVLLLLAADGHIVRGRAHGSWPGGQYEWTPIDVWLGRDLPVLDPTDARTELARRWLRRFGPATVDDLAWWTGWTKTRTATALSTIATVEVDIDGAPGVILADDTAPADDADPWVALLPALDPTTMGWKQRDWYLGEHRPALFDRNGNAGPTIWYHGRIVGGWAQGASGQIRTRLLEDVGSTARDVIAAHARRLEATLGQRRFTPRFRTPLERELTA